MVDHLFNYGDYDYDYYYAFSCDERPACLSAKLLLL